VRRTVSSQSSALDRERGVVDRPAVVSKVGIDEGPNCASEA
jgi:hypothetical protein